MVRVAVIGAGPWGINHVRSAAAERDCSLVCVADPNLHALARARALAPGVRTTQDVETIITDRSLDAVIIASPASTHAPLARAAMRAGKHVLVEKPLAMSLTVAREVATTADATGRIGMVGHLLVHHPAVRRLRELLHSGTLGQLHYLTSTRVNLGRLRHDENALWSFGPHDISIIDFLLSMQPLTVAARGQSVLQPGVEDVVFITMRYPHGEMAHVHLSWLHPRKERRVTLVCSNKMAEFDDVGTDKLRIYDKGYDRPPEFTEYAQYLTLRDGDVLIPQIAMEEPLRLQLKAFIHAIKSNQPPVNDLRSAVRVTAVLAAAQRSLSADGAPVEVETP